MFHHRFIFVVVASLWLASSSGWGQDDTPKPGLELLDQAIDKQLSVKRVTDIEAVAELCEQAIDAGLEDADLQFAKQMLASICYERAAHIRKTALLRLNRPDPAMFEIATRLINRSIELSPDEAHSYLLKAQLLKAQPNRQDEALAVVNQAIALFENAPRQRSQALLLRATMTDQRQAQMADFDQAIEDDPNNLRAWRIRGLTHLRNSQLDKAVSDLLHVVELDSDDISTLAIVAEIQLAQDNDAEALALLDDAVTEHPRNGSVYRLRAGVYAAQDKIDEALNDLESALRIDPSDLSALLERASIYREEKNYTEALADVSRVLELRPGLSQAYRLRSDIALDAQDFDQAISDLRQLLRRDPDNADLLHQLGLAYLNDNQPRLAIDTFDRVLRAHPKDVNAMRGRGDALVGLGQHENAIRSFESALEILPNDIGSLNNLAWILATSPTDELRDGKRARELAQQACEFTEFQLPSLLSTLAAAYAEEGDFENAQKYSKQAVKLSGDDPRQMEELKSYQQSKPWREVLSAEEDSNDDDLSDLGLLDEAPADASQAATVDSVEAEDPLLPFSKSTAQPEPATP